MKPLLLLICWLVLCDAKCLVWYQYSRVSDQKQQKRSAGSSSYGFGWGFGFESLSSRYECYDEGSYHQCTYVQSLMRETGINVNLFCYEHTVCAPGLPKGNGRWWCVNQDSIDQCKVGAQLLQQKNGTFECFEPVELDDNIPILLYRKPNIKTTSTTIASNTTITTTSFTSDSTQSITKHSIILLVLTIVMGPGLFPDYFLQD